MLTYKEKQEKLKLKRNEIAKLMVLANRPKIKIDIGTLAINPLERKTNFQERPEIPSINKITATDWNRFADNVDFLNEMEIENSNRITKLEIEVNLLSASSQLVNEKSNIKWLLDNIAYSDYKRIPTWDAISADNPNYQNNLFWGIEIDANRFLDAIRDNRKWVVDFQNIGGQRWYEELFGEIISDDFTYHNNIIRVFYFNTLPVSYMRRMSEQDGISNGDNLLGIPNYIRAIPNNRLDIPFVDDAKRVNLGVVLGIQKVSENPNKIYLMPAGRSISISQ